MDKLKDAAEKEERGRQNSDVPWYEREENKEKNEEENKDDHDDKGGNDE